MTELAIFGGKPTFDSSTLEKYNPIGVEEKEAVKKVMESGLLSGYVGSWSDDFFGGPAVKEFEARWAEKVCSKYAIAVNSNTSGLISAMGAIGIGPGDEVIVPPLSMSATAMAPLFYGGIPIFTDVEENTYCINPDIVKQKINPRTKGIIAVNLFGHPAALNELREISDNYGIKLIEDNAQAPLGTENGKYTGTIGHIGVFSLNYHKHIHCGEGGVCTTDDDDLAMRLQFIRNHAEACVEQAKVKDITNMIGFNFRMTEMCAAIGIEQLKKADFLIGERESVALKLNEGLKSIDGLILPTIKNNCRHVFYMWQSRFIEGIIGVSREVFSKALNAEGFPNFIGYVPPLYWLPVFQNKVAIGNNGFPFNLKNEDLYTKGMCPVSERLHLKELLGFDICGYKFNDNQIDMIISAFKKVYDNRNKLKAIKI